MLGGVVGSYGFGEFLGLGNGGVFCGFFRWVWVLACRFSAFLVRWVIRGV